MRFAESYYVQKEKKLCYFPIHKNASSTFTAFFDNTPGWQVKTKWDTAYNGYTFFAHIQNPNTRFFKGLAEIIKANKLLPLLSNPNSQEAAFAIYNNKHTACTRDIFGIGNRCINFIPMSEPETTKKITHNFLLKFDLDYPKLLTFKNQNVSTKKKAIVYDKLVEIYESNPKIKNVVANSVYPLYTEDHLLHAEASQRVNDLPYKPTYSDYLQRMARTEAIELEMTFKERLRYAWDFLLNRK